MARGRRAFAVLALVGRCGCLFLANFYKISHLFWFVNHFFHFFRLSRCSDWIKSIPHPRPSPLKNNGVASQTQAVRRLPERSDWIVLPQCVFLLNCIFNSCKILFLFLSCFYCVSFVSIDLYIIAHLDGFVNCFFQLFIFHITGGCRVCIAAEK